MVPKDLIFTKEHEWVQIEGDIATVGITHYAQGELGDIVFIELPETGEDVAQGESIGTIEAVKAVTDLFAPLSGEIVEINDALDGTPEIINQDPYGDGWMVRIKIADKSETENLLTAEQYKELIGE
ncbi:MAG TPA: glycine cleavage system protein GcvH [candidate division Zixibacteria bacterium]|nr:glycine cleavage system protein GcvH [candidate division Zixibacteria bacterium]